MIVNTYVTEQVARHTRQEREAAASAGRLAREASASRRQPIAPAAGQSSPQPSGVRIPRQRRWIDAVVASVR